MKPYTPQTLATRWGCSSQHIRNLIDEGEIPAFRLGKLIRIPASWVEKHEEGETWTLNGTKTNITLSGTKAERRSGDASRLPIVMKEGVV